MLLTANADAQIPDRVSAPRLDSFFKFSLTTLYFPFIQDGMTPLHWAARFRHDEAIKVLVQEGRAQLHVKDNVSNLNMFFLILSSFPQVREAAAGLG